MRGEGHSAARIVESAQEIPQVAAGLGVQREGDALNGADVAVGLLQVLDLDHRGHGTCFYPTRRCPKRRPASFGTSSHVLGPARPAASMEPDEALRA